VAKRGGIVYSRAQYQRFEKLSSDLGISPPPMFTLIPKQADEKL